MYNSWDRLTVHRVSIWLYKTLLRWNNSMTEQINDRILRLKDKILDKRKLEFMLNEAAQIFDEARLKASRYKASLDQSAAKLENLRGNGLLAYFLDLLGTAEARLMPSQQNLLATKLKLEEADFASAKFRKEEHTLRNQLARLISADLEYDAAINERSRLLGNTSQANEAPSVAEQICELTAHQTQLKHAQEIGETAKGALQQLQRLLHSAQDWCTYGRQPADMLAAQCKHSALDEIHEHVHVAQYHLRRLQVALGGASQRLSLPLDFTRVSRFSDMFYDALLADWGQQSDLRHSQAAIDATAANLCEIIRQCQARMDSLNKEVDSAMAQWTTFTEPIV